jgi:prevent-host-death family protein
MVKIKAHEAKKHFSNLLARVARGERFMITRRGVPVASLIPASLTHSEIVQGMRELRKRVKPGSPTIREMIAHGREG